MAKPGVNAKSQLNKIKSRIEESRKSFQDNIERFNASKEFIFLSGMDKADEANLIAAGKPVLSFNQTESYVSRLRGEFSIANPEIKMTPVSDSPQSQSTVKVLTSILRSILYNSASDSVDNEIYKDILGGGFSVLKVGTKYQAHDSFDQVGVIENVYDPTMCGFDLYAKTPHKGDGEYCYELYPKRKGEFEQMFPSISIDDLSFNKKGDGFSWAYTPTDEGEEVIIVCDYYVKNKKKAKYYRLSDGNVVDDKEYQSMQEQIPSSGDPVVMPSVVETKQATKTTIDRYRLIGSEVLDYEQTSFEYLPLIFFDGNSVRIKNKQTTRSYIHNVIDAQRAKNIAANCFFDEMQNLRATTLIADERGIPTNPVYQDAYLNPDERHAAMVYNGWDDDKQQMVAPPSALPRAPIPPELYLAFSGMDDAIQKGLGAYDAQQGDISSGNLSGKAIIAGATQSNAAAKPFMINYMASMNQVVKALLDIISKFYITPRTVPIINDDGTRGYRKINDPGDPESTLQYSPNDFDVFVSPGASFEAQKNQALEAMTSLAEAIPGVNQLLSGPGLPIVFENLDVKGAETLKSLAEQSIAQEKNAPQQPNPQQQEMELKQQQMQLDHTYKMGQLGIQQQQVQQGQDKLDMQKQTAYSSLMTAYEESQAEIQKASDQTQIEAAKVRGQAYKTALDHFQFMVGKTHEIAKQEF